MKKAILYFSMLILFISCVDTEQKQIIEEPITNSFFQDPDYRFGNKMIQNLYSDGQILYVASPTGIRYNRFGHNSNLYGPYLPQGINPYLHYFINKNWAIAPNEMMNGLAIYQQATPRMRPMFLPGHFPNADYDFLEINTSHPTYAINGNYLLFSVRSKQNGVSKVILANLDVLMDDDGRLYLDPYEQPIKTYQTLDFESNFNLGEINVRSIFPFQEGWLIDCFDRNASTTNLFIVESSGAIRNATFLINLGIKNLIDLTVSQSGDYYIIGKKDRLPSSVNRIIKIPQGNLDKAELLVSLHLQPSRNLRILDDKIVLFDRIFPFIQYIDFGEQKLKTIDTKDVGLVTYTDIVQHQGKVYLGTNNGLFYKELDKFWEYMDLDYFLESNAAHLRDKFPDLDVKVDISFSK